MTLLVFWSAPLDEDIDQIEVERSALATGPWSAIATLPSRDGYDNWVTHYEDEDAPTAAYYRAQCKKDGVTEETSAVKAGVSPYAVTPKMVLDQIQGLPTNRVSAEVVQRQIRWWVAQVEWRIRMKLSETTATQEEYGPEIYRKILGQKAGSAIQLRNFPVIDVDNVYYKIRGAAPGAQVQELTDMDIVIKGHNPASGYNHGQVSIWPHSASLAALFAGVDLSGSYWRHSISMLFTYRYGFTTWPIELEQLVAEAAAACVMEIAGEAETAGLSSRQVDGYGETYTASATTTIFSARRIWYEGHVKQIIKS
ncbi:MAG: hypothetical protein U9Q07_13395, partial [Planctomycetota bacterium]|nr:hypothetical protein [Planctomycetota bacterium]